MNLEQCQADRGQANKFTCRLLSSTPTITTVSLIESRRLSRAQHCGNCSMGVYPESNAT